MEGIFWKDGFEGICKGGIMFRAFELNKFIKNLEIKGESVVGIKFDDSNNIELISEGKENE
jgi:hypothetical protein